MKHTAYTALIKYESMTIQMMHQIILCLHLISSKSGSRNRLPKVAEVYKARKAAYVCIHFPCPQPFFLRGQGFFPNKHTSVSCHMSHQNSVLFRRYPQRRYATSVASVPAALLRRRLDSVPILASVVAELASNATGIFHCRRQASGII